MKRIPSGSLKCILLESPEAVGLALTAIGGAIPDESVVPFGRGAVLVHCEQDVSELRDRLRGCGEVLVMEFETWSGLGQTIPREWLLARGH
jgi:hypothetical protein